MEPLEALVQRLSSRPRRRSQYEPLDFEEVNGSMRSLPSGIAGADDAQSFDISSAIAPSQPSFARGQESDGPETPVQLASGGRGESNPFQFASGGQQAPVRQTAGGTTYQKVCENGKCQLVPVQRADGGGTALPPGVKLGPGEVYVPNSLREVGSSIGPPQPMAPRPAANQPTAPRPAPPPRPTAAGAPGDAMSVLSSLAETIRQDADRYDSEAARYYAEADANKAARDAIGFVQNDERGDIAVQAGINARSHYYMAQTALANQANLDRAYDQRAKRDRSKTLEGRLEDEASVIAARGKSIPVRAQQLFEIRTGVAAAQGRVMDEEQSSRQLDMILGEIYANDTSSYYLDYRSSVAQWRAGGGRDDAALQNAYAMRAEAFGGMLRRFGDAENREQLERRMRAELTPIFQARYTDYYKDNPSLLPPGLTGSAAALHARGEALRAVDTSIAQVARYLETGKSPYDAEVPPARTAPARSVNPRYDTQMVE